MTTDQMIADTKAAAAHIEHEWDAKALDWPLTAESVVVEVGGYTGRWALQIAERYHPRLYVFEPQPWAFVVCEAVLGAQATVLPFGLGATSGMLPMGDWGTDGASFTKPAGQGSGMLREIGRAFKDYAITTVDLLLMNIEGYEYTLLPHMLDQGITPQRLMVQFHDHADLDGSQRAAIMQRLAALGYAIAWEYWALTAWEKA